MINLFADRLTFTCIFFTMTLLAGPRPGQISDTFLLREGILSYQGRGWSVRSGGDLGWVSMRVGEDEFLTSSGTVGGFLFSDQDPSLRERPLFPERSILSHDRLAGHLGAVRNGVHMIRFVADPLTDDNELYLGANSDAEDLTCSLFLSSEVLEARLNDGTVVTRDTATPAQTHAVTLVHRNGSEIHIRSSQPKTQQPFSVGNHAHPSGEQVFTVIFPTPGFKANSYRIDFGSEARGPNFLSKPTFKVVSSDDPKGHNPFYGAAMGVINPEYGPDTELDYGFTAEWKGDAPFKGYAELEITHVYGQLHFYERVELETEGPGTLSGTFHPEFHLPGVSEVWLRIVDDSGRLLWQDRYRMLYDRDNFQPDIQVEPDFKAFWQNTLEEARRFPLDLKMERVAKYKDIPNFEVYALSYAGWQGKRVHAMLYAPRDREGPSPAIVTGHPSARGFGINTGKDGVFGSKVDQEKGFVTIVPLIRGYEIDAPDVPFNPPWWGPLEDRDTYVARAWYVAMVRAVDVLASLPDLVDMSQVVAAGGSQGGALAIVTAALDPRVSYCFADCPSNAQPHEIMRYYESFGPSYGIIPAGSSKAEVEKLLSYYNPVNFAPLIKVTTHVGINIGDVTVHSMGPLSIYRNLTGLEETQKTFHPGFTHFHGSASSLGRARRGLYQELLGKE